MSPCNELSNIVDEHLSGALAVDSRRDILDAETDVSESSLRSGAHAIDRREHGWPRSRLGQCFHRAFVANGDVREGLR